MTNFDTPAVREARDAVFAATARLEATPANDPAFREAYDAVGAAKDALFAAVQQARQTD